MKVQGDRKKQSAPHHLDKYSDKYSSSSKSKYGQTYKDRRPPIVEKSTSQKTNDEAPPSQHLWIGNVSTSVTKTMLAEQFSRFGDIESIKLFSQKNYAFVTLKTVEDAVYAKKGLHGTVLGGLAVRIEFARGAHDGRLNVHAEVDEKNLNEKDRQTEEKIIYQDKGQKDGTQEKNAAPTKLVPLDDISRHSSTDLPKGNKNGDPSEVLWIGFPLHLKIDEKKLHKLFGPFGGVEKITTFPGRTYAFVRFQNVKAAARAKDALQGKLFDDPRVSISFAKSEVGPVDHVHASNELQPPSPLKAGTRTVSSTPLKREEGTSMLPSNVSLKVGMESGKHSIVSPKREVVLPSIAPLPSFGSLTSRSEPPHVGKESHWLASHFFPSRSATGMNDKPYSSPNQSLHPKVNIEIKDDFLGNAGSKHAPEADSDKGMQMLQNDNFSDLGEPKSDDNWMLHEYSNIRDQKRGRFEMDNPSGALSSIGSPSAMLDKLRPQGEDGEAKRQRLGNEHFWVEIKNSKLPEYANQRGPLFSHDTWDDQVVGNTRLLGRTPVASSKKEEVNVSLGPEENLEARDGSHRGLLGKMPPADSIIDQPLGSQSEHGLVESPISPAGTDAGSPICPPPKDVFRWEGTIAKGGTEVCRCRCFPATKEIDVMFPEILNCTARTSLDMLAQYISQVRDFSVVLFMPQGVPDVAPYQELMAFLAEKKRAAVCKLSEENTLFLVPPSDFVEQFLNVPKSNNILGVVLGQQKQRSPPLQTAIDHSVSLKSQQTFESKRQGHQKLVAHALSEDPGMIPVHSSTDMKAIKSLSQPIGYQLERSKLDPGGSVSFENMFGKNRLSPDMAQDHEVATDSGRIAYGTQGNKLFPSEHQPHEKSPLPDIRNLSFLNPGNIPMPPIPLPLPMAHGLHMFGKPSLPPGGKMPPHQDPVMLPRPPNFFPPCIAEQLSMPGSNQTIGESQKPVGSFSIPERPWSVPVLPHSVPMTQVNPPMVHLQQSFSYGPTAQQQLPSFDGRQQDGPVQPSSFAFRTSAPSTRSMPSPYSLASESGPRPPGLPPGLFSLDSAVRPPVPSKGTPPADRDKQGSETDQQQAFQIALAGMQNPNSTEEDQKKFRATVELAAALLQQLQQQTKL